MRRESLFAAAGAAMFAISLPAPAAAQARPTLLDHHGHPLHAQRVSAYWKRGVADFHERLDA